MRWFVFLFICVNFVTARQSFDLFQDFETWKENIYFNLDNANASESCKDQLLELMADDKDDLWKFFDATSKFPWSGLSVSSIFDWGNYDQCLNIDHKYSRGNIKGKYCLFSILLPINLTKFNVDPTELDNFYKLSVCMPNACTPKDYNAILNISLFQNVPCHTREDLDEVATGDIAMIVFLVVIFTIMVISTWYDVYLKRRNKKSAHPLYLAFSVYTNTKKVLKTSKNQIEQIQIFNGMKTISMAWILAGHAMNGWNQYSVINDNVLSHRLADLRNFYVSGSQLAVDTFFYISGFLIAYNYMKQKAKPMLLQIKSLPVFIMYRYVRLTPAVAVLFFFLTTIFKFMGDGPIWLEGFNSYKKNCHQHYLSFFTYTQNYVNHNDICLIHTWYLSADMQLFIFTAIVLIPLSVLLAKSPKNLKMVMVICFLMNIFFTFLPLATKLIWTNYINLYDTHSRVIDYSVGIMMGIFLRETKDKPFLFNKFSNPQIINLVIWLIVLPIMGSNVVLYEEFIYTGKHSQTTQSFFYSFYRPIWCIGLSWIVYTSYYGYGGIVSWILNRPILQITAKLSYCMYLVHGFPIIYSIMSTKIRMYFSDWISFSEWCGFFTITILISFAWTVSFESPMITIGAFIFGRGPSKKHRKNSSKKQIV